LDNSLSIFLTPRHTYDVRKDSDQSNHTILKVSWQSCDLIGHYLFWNHSFAIQATESQSLDESFKIIKKMIILKAIHSRVLSSITSFCYITITVTNSREWMVGNIAHYINTHNLYFRSTEVFSKQTKTRIEKI
jgi:hypothetical protein